MSLKYRSEIDGLRSIAVLAVILFHAGFNLFKGGFIGVDIFFVISGFLITKIIITEIDTGVFSIVNFYERRARRIMPMIFTVMFFSFVASWFILLPSDMKLFSKSIIGVSTFTSNILFWKESGYWDLSSELKPLLHTWTLSLEEQFYVILPLLLLLLLKTVNKKWTLIVVSIIFFTSLIGSHWASSANTEIASANFYLLPSRLWELGFGSLIAIISVHNTNVLNNLNSNDVINQILSFFGVLMIFYAIFFFDESTPYPSIYTIIPILGTGFIIVFAKKKTITQKILSLPFMVKVGLISYSLYLWHQPIFAFFRYKAFPEPSPTLMFILVIITFPLSYFSWKYIENPFRNKAKFSRKKIFGLTFLGTVFFLLLGGAGYLTDGFKSRSLVTELSIKKYQPDNAVLKKESWNVLRTRTKNEDYFVKDNLSDHDLWFDKNDSRTKMLLVGNSHSKDLYNSLYFSEMTNKNFQIARYGTQISELKNSNNEFFNSPNYLNADIVMIVSKYFVKDVLALEDITNKLLEDEKKIVIVKNIYQFSEFGNRTLADFYIQNSGIKQESKQENLDILIEQINSTYYKEYIKGSQIEFDHEKVINRIANKNKGIVCLDRMDYVCDDSSKKCFAINNSLEKYFYDYGHNTIEGAKFFGKRIDDVNWLKEVKNK